MNPFAGKNASERNKMIAAIVLGVLSLFALYLAFGRGLFSSSTTKVTAKASPTPKTTSSPGSSGSGDMTMPSPARQEFEAATTAIVYRPQAFGAPPAGRNIFAFYEPPPPCPTCPTPTPIQTPVKPLPTPTPPPVQIVAVMPQTVYAGSGAFRLEVNGDKFDPSFHVYFQQSEIPTQFVSPQKLVANIPATMTANEGAAQVMVQSPDGKLYSNQVIFNIQAPPKPQFQYIGMIARSRHNNDTAYFQEDGKPTPTGARLNDVVAGRFRLISISSTETVFEDVSLGFKHRLPLYRPAPGTTAGPTQNQNPRQRGGYPMNGYQPYNPNMQNPPMQQDIPGIPNNVPRYVPPQQPGQMQPGQTPGQVQIPPQKKDEDDDDGDGNN